MNSERSAIILPVENQVRELDAKLLFACAAAERGYPVVLGSRTYIHFAMPSLPRGIFVAKSMRASGVLMFNIIRDLGNAIVAWDEESLVRYASPEYYPWRFSERTFRPVDHLFAWGPDDAELFAAYPGNPGIPVHVTGNPRTDLLRRELRGYFAKEAAALRARFGDFILVNTNFAFVNNFVPMLNLLVPGGNGANEVGRTGTGMSLSFAQGMSAHQQAIFDGFRELVPRLAEWFPDRAIVIRPHPSEHHGRWRDLTSGLDNVHIIHEGNVVPWLLACRVLLHNGCTTAVEGAVLETPAVTYQPVTSDCYDYHLPNGLSHRAYTPDHVRGLLAAILDEELGTIAEAERRRLFNRHLVATEGPLAVDRVMDVLEEAGCASVPPRPPGVRAPRARIVCHARTALKWINARRRGHWNSAAYHAHRFPEISSKEINDRIDRFRELLGRFDGVHAEPDSRFMFRVRGPARKREGAATAPVANVDQAG